MRQTTHPYIQHNGLHLIRFFWLLSTILLTACSSFAGVHPSAKTPQNTSTAHPTLTMSHTPIPTLDDGTVPPSRKGTQLIYDNKTHSLLLFGGNEHVGGRDVNDTWTWDGTHWRQFHPMNSPSPREGASLAYNSDTGQVVLFGGLDPNRSNTTMAEKPLNDTWIWDGSNWTQAHPIISPPARQSAAMVYDPTSKQIVLFGGGGDGPLAPNQTFPALNDTWTWDGSNWTQRQPTNVPPARQIPNMDYNAITHNIVLFGGFNYNTEQQLLDTWTWDGSNWTQIHPATSPSAALTINGKHISFDNFASMIYDTATQRTMLTCIGYDTANEKQKFEAIWLWNGSNWIQQAVVGPDDGFIGGVITYDADLHTALQFSAYLPKNSRGEFSYIFIDKLWKWSGQGWITLDAWNK